MISTSDFCQKEYGSKLYKISFDAGFSCPNRDGTLHSRGCIFCSEGGSGDFAVKLPQFIKTPWMNNPNFEKEQEAFEGAIAKAKQMVAAKYSGDKYIAYFQAYTNTYADIEILRNTYESIIRRDDIAVLSIATRPDCISEETYKLLDELNRIKPVWVELGLQTVKAESVRYIRRGYENSVYAKAIKRLNEIGIHTITHVILYLPGETKENMFDTVRYAVDSGTKGIKLQLLHVLKGTDLGEEYLKNPENFIFPTLEEYVGTVDECISICPKNMVFHRLTGDPPRELLLSPMWATDKKRILNLLRKRNS